MKRPLFITALAVLTIGVSCSKEVALEETPHAITFTASISEPDTKTTYSESAGVISATFEVDDELMVFDPAGNSTIFKAISVDASGVAKFTGTPTTPFTSGSTITAILLNEAVTKDKFSSDTKKIEAILDYQNGTLSSAGKNEVLWGQGTYDPTADNQLPMTFTRKTSIVKFVLSIPAGESPSALKDIRLSSGTSSAKTYKNRVNVNVLDGTVDYTADSGLQGDLQTNANVLVNEGKAEVYFAVPAIALQNAIIQAVPTNNLCKRYVWRVAGATALTPEAGYSYTLTRTSPRLAWSSSSSAYIVKDDAISINGTDIPENTTGKPKQTKTTATHWGYTYVFNVTQIEMKDIVGSATFTGDTRVAANKGTVAKATATNTTGAKYGSLGGVTVNYYYDDGWTAPASAAGTATPITITASGDANHNLNISGLYQNLIMPANVVLDYENNTFSFALYIEKNHVFTISDGPFKDEYAKFATELYNGGSTYYLGFADGGAFEYVGTPSTSASGVFTLTFKEHQKCTAYTNYYVKGIMINRFATNAGNGAAMIRSTKNPWDYTNYKLSGSAYAWVTQGDFTITK